MATITMTYGAFDFSSLGPIPLMTVRPSFDRSTDGQILGETWELSLDNVLTPLPNNDTGALATDALLDNLYEAMKIENQLFSVKCGDNVIFEGYPTVADISFDKSTDNWVQTIPYIINMTFPESHPGSGSNFIADASEEWNVEPMEGQKFEWGLASGADANPYQFRLTHTVSAVGKRRFISGVLEKEAWEQAQDYVISKLGYNSNRIGSSGVLNFTPANFVQYDHVRTNTIDELGGSFGVTESWVVINPSGNGVAGNAIEDFTATVTSSINDARTTVSVEGSIQGLATIDYGNNLGDHTLIEDKYSAASGYFDTVEGRLYDRARIVSDNIVSRTLNISPVTKVIGHSPSQGAITYNYEYNDRPTECVAGALSESITISDSNPSDRVALLTILGRTNGPIIQPLNTKTEFTRTLNIDLLVQPPTGCITTGNIAAYLAESPKSDTDSIVDAIEDNLEGSYGTVARTQDTDNWVANQGTYSRTVTWIAGNC